MSKRMKIRSREASETNTLMDLPSRASGRIEMTAQEECALWRQRFFEAQAGMERYLVEAYGANEIARWLPVRAEILQGLDDQVTQSDDIQSWKERYFRTQAALE